MATPVPFASFHSKSFGLTFSRVHSHWKTTADLFNAQHSIQFARMKRSFTSAHVLCSSFNGSSLSSRITCWVCTPMVKVPVTLSKELPAGLGLCSARTIDLPVGLGLHSANFSNSSADVGLRTASRNSNKMFQLIVGYVFTVRFKQQYQRKLQQDLVDVWLSNAILNVNLQTTNSFQQVFASHFSNGCFCKFISTQFLREHKLLHPCWLLGEDIPKYSFTSVAIAEYFVRE